MIPVPDIGPVGEALAHLISDNYQSRIEQSISPMKALDLVKERYADNFDKYIKMLMYPIFTIAMILGLAYIMNYSGMSSTLGLAFTATGSAYPFFAPFLGWLGVFLTGSDTSSNALFGSMQKTAAQQLGIDPNLTVAANSSGGVCGKMLSPQSISVATAATGLVGQESTIFRFALPSSIAMIIFIGILTYLQSTVLHWMLP